MLGRKMDCDVFGREIGGNGVAFVVENLIQRFGRGVVPDKHTRAITKALDKEVLLSKVKYKPTLPLG